MCKIPWCPYCFKDILDASYHMFSYQNQQIIRHPCKTKAICPFFHFIKHISFSCTTLLVLRYSNLGHAAPTNLEKILILQKRALRLIHIKPFRFHAVPLFKLSIVIPLDFLSFKTICLIMPPPSFSNLLTYSSKVHHHNTRFSAAGNFYIEHSRTDHMKNSFSRIGAEI